eukprot:287496-Rhodomonas_salina.2
MAALNPDIQYTNPHFEYNLRQECGFLYSSLQCEPGPCRANPAQSQVQETADAEQFVRALRGPASDSAR